MFPWPSLSPDTTLKASPLPGGLCIPGTSESKQHHFFRPLYWIASLISWEQLVLGSKKKYRLWPQGISQWLKAPSLWTLRMVPGATIYEYGLSDYEGLLVSPQNMQVCTAKWKMWPLEYETTYVLSTTGSSAIEGWGWGTRNLVFEYHSNFKQDLWRDSQNIHQYHKSMNVISSEHCNQCEHHDRYVWQHTSVITTTTATKEREGSSRV